MNVYVALSYLLVAVPFVAAIVLALGLCVLVIGLAGSPVVGVWLAIASHFLGATGIHTALNLGISIYPDDLCFITIGAVTLGRIANGKLARDDRICRAWMLLGMVWFAIFAVGVVHYKSFAGVQFRDSYYLWVAASYLMTFRLTPRQVHQILNAMLAAGLAMTVLAGYRWGLVVMGEFGPWFDYHTPTRVVASEYTQLIALAAMPGIAMWLGLTARRPLPMLAALLLLGAVLILAHRTVWVACAAALAAGWWLAGRQRASGRLGLLLPLALGAVVIVGTFSLAPESTVSRELARSVNETAQKNSTLAWRQDSWKSLIADWANSGPLVWPAGKPFGSDNTRYIESQGMKTSVTAHNHYIAILYNGGVLGLGAYLAAVVLTFRRLLRHRPQAGDAVRPEVLMVLLVLCLVYGIGYSLDYMQGMMLGLAFSLAVSAFALPLRSPRAAPAPDLHAPRHSPYLP